MLSPGCCRAMTQTFFFSLPSLSLPGSPVACTGAPHGQHELVSAVLRSPYHGGHEQDVAKQDLALSMQSVLDDVEG